MSSRRRRPITDEEIRRVFSVDIETGVLKKWGHPIGCSHPGGYTQLVHRGQNFLVHRVVWFLIHGYWPSQLDHINGIRNDNRPVNLRELTQSQNLLNVNKRMRTDNSSGTIGVSRDGKRWRAWIQVNRKFIGLGRYDTVEQAIEARKKAEVKYCP